MMFENVESNENGKVITTEEEQSAGVTIRLLSHMDPAASKKLTPGLWYMPK